MTRTTDTPLHWETTTLEEIAEVRLGRQRSPDRATGDHMRPYMRAANVTWAGISLHDVKEMDFTPTEFQTYELRRGDILLAEASGSASEVGKPAVWKDELPNCCFQNTLLRVRANESLPRFLYLHFMKDALTGAFASASRGVGIHHLGAQAMCEWKIRLPPLEEQDRIVDAVESYFTRLDDAIATLGRVERNLSRYRESVLKAAVEGRLVPTEAALAKQEGRSYEPASVLLERILTERRRRWSGSGDKRKYQEPTAPETTNLPVLPKGWCWASAEQISEFITKGTTPAAEYLSTGSGDVPYIKVYNLTSSGALNFSLNPTFIPRQIHEDELGRSVVYPGDVLMNIVGPPLGKVSIVPDSHPEWNINQAVVRYRPMESIEGAFLALLLRSEPALAWAKRRAKATSGQLNLTLEICRQLPVPLPPSAEQRRIVAAASLVESTCDQIAATVETAALRCVRLRQSILKWAFEGKLADQDANDEPASALLERIKAEREAGRPTKTTGAQRTAIKKQVRA